MASASTKHLQRAVNARLAARGLPRIVVDGELGPETRAAIHRVKYLLGYPLDRTTRTRSGNTYIFHPSKRPAAYRALAKKRKLKKPALRVRAYHEMDKWARAGVHEAGGNNIGPIVSAIIRTAGGTPGEPWCGDTVAAAYIRAGSKTAHESARRFAYVPYIKGLLTHVRSPALGHVVTYDFQGDGTEDHTGIFVRWVDRAAGIFLAIEGNTSPGSRTSDGSGADGVYYRQRSVKADGAKFYRVLR